MSKVFKWYNIARLFSFGAMFMFVAGGRGIGKTYSGKKYIINRAIKHREQFIYLRRFKSDLKMRAGFFSDIAYEFPEWEFQVNGSLAQMRKRGEDKAKWIDIGMFVALTNAQNYKSGAFPNVKTILFDEFIIEKGFTRYIDDEYNVFLNFYNTVDRWQDKTKVLFFANAVSIDNPYFVELSVRPTEQGQFIQDPSGGNFWVAEFPDSAAFADQVFETRFGKFIKNSEYAKYAVGNEFADNHEKLLESKNSHARYEFTLETRKGTFSIWRDLRAGKFYVQGKQPKDPVVYTMVAASMSEEKTLIVFGDRPLSELRTAYRHGRVFFDTPPTRNNFLEVFRR